ncbi:heat shock 70 kDa protein 4-like [Tropilaelaps mercedesae]|uniref:Heat shock 70 kDa protein 4-like n=1 Tax=Tropilaelaps mercedesae TaxID=418985 RepID=A0A1V9XFJ3_9ACAR|nr:heat shock 70 kDa protein 4-like [Tropilaelaps mercedesae]
MSVIGIDFGNENCFIAVARAGGIETIANEYSQRVTPSYVAFGERQRDLGVSAKNKQNMNLKSTIYGFKRLVGRKFRDPAVEQERMLLPYQLIEMSDGEVGVKVRYCGQDQEFSSRQITGMLFTKLKIIAEENLKIKVADCVISVPLCANDAERRAILDAARIGGLNCLKLMNETAAVALSYGFYKNLPEDKLKLIAFVDMGHSALQVSIVGFGKDKLKMLSCETEIVGGRDFDKVLVDYFCENFKTNYKLDVQANKRALIRLYTECEKLKKQMSSISVELPLNIECFMEDKDVAGKMKRETFEELAAHLLTKVEVTLQKAITNCPPQTEGKPVTAQDLEGVEIVGGSSRVPAIKAIIKKVFGREPSTTINADEAVARGCALQCAMLSPTFKVKDFSLTDLQPYPIMVRITPQTNGNKPNEYDVFPRFHQVPFSRVLSIYRRDPFQVEACYRNETPFADKSIGVYTVNVKPTNAEASEDDKVKVKVRVNLHGIFGVVSATLIEKSDEPPKEMEAGETDQRQSEPSGAEMETDQVKDPKEKETTVAKRKTKQTEMSVVLESASKDQGELVNLCNAEIKMLTADRTEQQRQDAKNAVEEYVYDMRDKLAGSLASYSAPDEKERLSTELRQTEDWLYGDGEDLDKKAYTERLDRLYALGQPISERWQEAEQRPRVLEEIGALLNRIRKGVAAYRAGDAQYAHLLADDINCLETVLARKQAWFDEAVGKLNNTPKHCAPPVFVAQLREESAAFERMANHILNKPKPTPPVVEQPKEPRPDSPPDAKKQDKDEPMNTDDHPPPATDEKPEHLEKPVDGASKDDRKATDKAKRPPPNSHNGNENKMEVE